MRQGLGTAASPQWILLDSAFRPASYLVRLDRALPQIVGTAPSRRHHFCLVISSGATQKVLDWSQRDDFVRAGFWWFFGTCPQSTFDLSLNLRSGCVEKAYLSFDIYYISKPLLFVKSTYDFFKNLRMSNRNIREYLSIKFNLLLF